MGEFEPLKKKSDTFTTGAQEAQLQHQPGLAMNTTMMPAQAPLVGAAAPPALTPISPDPGAAAMGAPIQASKSNNAAERERTSEQLLKDSQAENAPAVDRSAAYSMSDAPSGLSSGSNRLLINPFRSLGMYFAMGSHKDRHSYGDGG